jgi:hypothetical protein
MAGAPLAFLQFPAIGDPAAGIAGAAAMPEQLRLPKPFTPEFPNRLLNHT